MPLMYLRHSLQYHLGYFSHEWEHTPLATGAIAEFYRWHACEVELKLTKQACRQWRLRLTNVAGHFCSYIGTVSQEVLAAMSQVHQQHMRTRLKNGILHLQCTGIFLRALSILHHIIRGTSTMSNYFNQNVNSGAPLAREVRAWTEPHS